MELRISDIETGGKFRLATSVDKVMEKLSDVGVGENRRFRYECVETGKRVETRNDYFVFEE